MSFSGVFPFGQPSTERPARRPTSGPAAAFLLGVYPSALHVCWRPPRWLVKEVSHLKGVRALAIDVEPVVFWDGAGADAYVDAWKQAISFREGDDRDSWGHVTPHGNGTSGATLGSDVLTPLNLDAAKVWYSDVVPWYFVKRSRSHGGRREQGDAIDTEYAPLVARDPRLAAACLPTRPSPRHLVRWASAQRRATLRKEILESEAPLLVTVGEEARLVAAGIADHVEGAPTHPLCVTMQGYGELGAISILRRRVHWLALRHPAQHRAQWDEMHCRWVESVRGPAIVR